MFKLIKLAAVALFGYAVYEFLRGMTGGASITGAAKQAANKIASEAERVGGRFASANTGNGFNMTGPGQGTEQQTLDSDGGAVRHKVGRGVVH